MSTQGTQTDLRERYMRDDEPTRFGNLASTLARAARGAQIPTRRETVARVLREACNFATWSAESNAAQALSLLPMRTDLTSMLGHWESSGHWDAVLAAEVAAKCRAYSDQALALSGLLD